jgi:hypothetical protein
LTSKLAVGENWILEVGSITLYASESEGKTKLMLVMNILEWFGEKYQFSHEFVEDPKDTTS